MLTGVLEDTAVLPVGLFRVLWLTKGCGAGGVSGNASFDSFGFTSELPPRDLFPEKLIEKDDRDGVLAPEAAPLIGWPDCRLDDSPEPKEGVLATDATPIVGLLDCKLEESPEPNAGVLATEEAPPVGWPDCKLDENTEPNAGVLATEEAPPVG